MARRHLLCIGQILTYLVFTIHIQKVEKLHNTLDILPNLGR